MVVANIVILFSTLVGMVITRDSYSDNHQPVIFIDFRKEQSSNDKLLKGYVVLE